MVVEWFGCCLLACAGGGWQIEVVMEEVLEAISRGVVGYAVDNGHAVGEVVFSLE